MDLPFTAWTPDLPALNNPGLVRAHNCTAGRGGAQGGVTYFPLKSASLYSNTSMDNAPIGATVAQDKFGNAKVYAGSATKLYKLAPNTRQWTNVSRAAGYTTTAKERWNFLEYGALQIATNFNDEPQFIDVNTDLQFANLTTLVKGRHIATTKGFVILGNTYDAIDGFVPNRVRWSALEDPTSWSFSAQTMSDFQDIQGLGSVQGIVTDDSSAYVLLSRGIVQMMFVGSPYIFQFTDRVVGKGCAASESVITVEGKTFFLSDDGFYVMQGGSISPIGSGKIDRWFMENADLDQKHLMTVAADPKKSLIHWSFVSKNATNASPDLMLIFNYQTGEWTTAQATTHVIWNSMSLPWTLDQLDSFGSLDNLPASLDDPIWAGGQAQLWGIDKTGKVYSFSGATMPLSIETQEFSLAKGSQSGADIAVVSSIRPLFEGAATARLQVGKRSLPNDTTTWSSLVETHLETGRAYVREKSRYTRFKVSLTGEWQSASGIEVEAKAAGKR